MRAKIQDFASYTGPHIQCCADKNVEDCGVLRRLEDQFEGRTVIKIRELLQRVESLNTPRGVSRYYRVDLSLCLEAGALLGALHVAASLLEITVREMVITYAQEALSGNMKVNLQKELEENRHLGFKTLVDKLTAVELFDSRDADLAKQFYNDIRIPIHHGLSQRFVSKHKLFEKALVGAYGISMHAFEDVIEEESLRLIETAIGIIERNKK
jgi:hypothetical protein